MYRFRSTKDGDFVPLGGENGNRKSLGWILGGKDACQVREEALHSLLYRNLRAVKVDLLSLSLTHTRTLLQGDSGKRGTLHNFLPRLL